MEPTPEEPAPPALTLVTICILNYNYGRFLDDAIGSALRQTHPQVEVVVVDDGSTDDSRARIAAYGGSVVPVHKANGGQGSAANAGFAVARGEVVIFLDADDVLLPHVAERVAAAFVAEPSLSKVQYRMAVTDGAGVPTGVLLPRADGMMPNGDLSSHLAKYRSWTWQPTSGNAFAASALRLVLPIPEERYPTYCDAYLNELVPYLGPVRSLDEVCAHYRHHGSNDFVGMGLDLRWLRNKIDLVLLGHAAARRLTVAVGRPGPPADPTAQRDVAFLAYRLASLKLDPAGHPVAGDSALGVAARGAWSSLTYPHLPRPQRLKRAAWFAAVGPAPARLAKRIFDIWVPDSPRSTRRWQLRR